MTAMLEAALEHARRGIPVLPVKPRGKKPVTGHAFKDATTHRSNYARAYNNLGYAYALSTPPEYATTTEP